ncbi:MarR family transcriptional regulator [Cellulomonas sp. JH27-2]|uniref:MarR family transcriptional regulator n=1 Tax=Cellulomonas sp. JH27-2 TaxID=2774139 RepID=UPI0017804914|nr:helix-turn-helix domain-containing protein [Cellulomonas sp. JH27-2]MBD8059722.1 MarR family transcriptional regulator [Cellulomonas sp. JH27-2]
MAGLDPDLLRALVALAETLDGINSTVRHEAEQRAGQRDVPPDEVTILRMLLRASGVTLAECAQATEKSLATTRRALQDLVARGLVVTSSSDERAATFAATPAAVALRAAARERSARHLRYALTALPAVELEDLVRAAPALSALAASLGFRDLHPSLRPAASPGSGERPAGLVRYPIPPETARPAVD